MRRYAERTNVPVQKSRGEIDKLLRNWGATGIQWTDDLAKGMVHLRFAWTYHSTSYMARFDLRIDLPAEDDALDRRNGAVSQAKLMKLRDNVGKREHRVLALWLKAAFNAVEEGLIEATVLFLPFLEDKNGRTVAEVAMPRLEALVSGSAVKLLGSGT